MLLSRPTAASWEENRLSPRRIPTSGRHVSACGDRCYPSREPHCPVSGGKPGNPGRFRVIRPPAPHCRRGDRRSVRRPETGGPGAVAPPPRAPVFPLFPKVFSVGCGSVKEAQECPTPPPRLGLSWKGHQLFPPAWDHPSAGGHFRRLHFQNGIFDICGGIGRCH